MPLFNPIEERMRGHNSSGSDVIAGGDRIGNTSSYYTYRIESTRSIPPPTSQLIFGARNVSIVFRTLWRLGKLAKPLANHRTVHPWFKVRQLIERTFHYSNRILNHCLTIFSIAIESSINFWSLVPFSIGHLSTIIKEISRNRYIYIYYPRNFEQDFKRNNRSTREQGDRCNPLEGSADFHRSLLGLLGCKSLHPCYPSKQRT